MTEPIMLSVASAVAGRATEAAVDASKTALNALVRLVRERLGRSKPGQRAIQRADAAPENRAFVEELAQALEDAASADLGFAVQVRLLWPQAQTELHAQQGGVINTSTGTVGGHLVQARDMHVEGGLHLGNPPGQA
jgi:hypothetical protein